MEEEGEANGNGGRGWFSRGIEGMELNFDAGVGAWLNKTWVEVEALWEV